MKFNDALSGFALLALSLLILFTVRTYPDIPGQNIGPGAFPGLLAWLLALCSVILIFKGLKTKKHEYWAVRGAWMKSWFHLRNFIVTVACLLFYIFASDFLGFLLCGILILSVMFAALEVRAKWILPIAIVVTFAVHIIFYKGLRVPLPWGLLTPIQW